MDLHAIAIILINSGLDPIKCWNTILFHTPKTPVHTTFNHKNYGYAKGKKNDPMFHDHVTRATRWFRGEIAGQGCKKRAMKRERQIREGLVTELQYATHASLLLAHDISFPGVEGGAKDYFLASPWQFLNTPKLYGAVPRNPLSFREICETQRILLSKLNGLKRGSRSPTGRIALSTIRGATTMPTSTTTSASTT